jgi:hypothetical protein
MPQVLKWSLMGCAAALCGGAAYLMAVRGPAIFLDLGSALAGCF